MSQPVQEQGLEQGQFSFARLIQIGIRNPVSNPQLLQTMSSGTITFGVLSYYPHDYERELAIWKLLTEHAAQLEKLTQTQVITDEDKREVLKQHELLLRNYDKIVQHKGETVVACAGEFFFGDNLDDAVKKARGKHGKKPYYAQTIDLIAFPALFPADADKFLL